VNQDMRITEAKMAHAMFRAHKTFQQAMYEFEGIAETMSSTPYEVAAAKAFLDVSLAEYRKSIANYNAKIN